LEFYSLPFFRTNRHFSIGLPPRRFGEPLLFPPPDVPFFSFELANGAVFLGEQVLVLLRLPLFFFLPSLTGTEYYLMLQAVTVYLPFLFLSFFWLLAAFFPVSGCLRYNSFFFSLISEGFCAPAPLAIPFLPDRVFLPSPPGRRNYALFSKIVRAYVPF